MEDGIFISFENIIYKVIIHEVIEKFTHINKNKELRFQFEGINMRACNLGVHNHPENILGSIFILWLED
jgi:hypothetical protein